MLFHWIPIMAILVLPSAMTIMAIWPFLAVMAHMAMADSKTNMAIMGIKWKSMEKLTQQSWFQLSSTFHSKVMAIWNFVLGAYIVTYTLKITRLEPNLPPLEGIELQRFKRHFWKWHGSGNKMGGWPLLGFDFEVNKNCSTMGRLADSVHQTHFSWEIMWQYFSLWF